MLAGTSDPVPPLRTVIALPLPWSGPGRGRPQRCFRAHSAVPAIAFRPAARAQVLVIPNNGIRIVLARSAPNEAPTKSAV